MTEEKAALLIAKHQERIGLGDWNVQPLVRDCDELIEGTWGRVHYNTERLEAVIELPSVRNVSETEQTICHELVHLALCEFREIAEAAISVGCDGASRGVFNELLGKAEERLCNRLARALSGVSGGIIDREKFVTAEG